MLLGTLETCSGVRATGAQLGNAANHLRVHQPRVHRLCMCPLQAAERPRQLPGGGSEHTARQVVGRSCQAPRLSGRPAAENHEQRRSSLLEDSIKLARTLLTVALYILFYDLQFSRFGCLVVDREVGGGHRERAQSDRSMGLFDGGTQRRPCADCRQRNSRGTC